ncbi:hypothetical protein PVW48_07685 [Dinoroseobacter sp. PD6]|uniref:hypothetical protein n=1 Tax=Dinoroseobacter sp. PD6 TaxID=3028384 RepID=UPI00237C3886|nr:hypothetical protein [Dinoroseobacter sp. PD6]MDD9716618.1 hypothetical protein [Dinoroseobacter sp. PD6]
MTPASHVFANCIVDRFTRGQLMDLTEMYATPVAVYFGDRILVLQSREDLHAALSSYRSILVRAGLAFIQTTVMGTPRFAQARFSMRVRNTYFDQNGHAFDDCEVTYFIERDATCDYAPKIRLAEYDRWPCEDEVAAAEALRQLETPTARGSRAILF